MTVRKISVFALAIAASIFTHASPKIQGEWIQGALLKGRTEPGNKVFIFDREVAVTDSGQFVFGLGRDAPKTVSLWVQKNGQEKEHFEFSVKQREYKTQRIEGVEQKYVAPPPEVSQRIRNETAQVRKARQKVRKSLDYLSPFLWPAKGPITGVYGSQRVFNGVPKRPHYGLDIAGPVGAEVVAPAPGIVSLVHNDMYYSGGTLIVDHGYGVSSTFIHLSKIHVKEGMSVVPGQLIAEIGATGRVTGPHLDWRINWFNQRLDPALLLPNASDTAKNAIE